MCCSAILCQFTNFEETVIHAYRDCGQTPVTVSYYLKNSHFPLSKTFANLHLLKRLGGQQQVEEIWKTSTILILEMGLCSVNMWINCLKNWIISQKVSLRFVFCFLLVCFLDYFSFTLPVYWKKNLNGKLNNFPNPLFFFSRLCSAGNPYNYSTVFFSYSSIPLFIGFAQFLYSNKDFVSTCTNAPLFLHYSISQNIPLQPKSASLC